MPHSTENSCGRCKPGWLLLNTTCYFHSKSASLPLKNWWDSRTDCRARGGNLTVIDNIEEQVKRLKDMVSKATVYLSLVLPFNLFAAKSFSVPAKTGSRYASMVEGRRDLDWTHGCARRGQLGVDK